MDSLKDDVVIIMGSVGQCKEDIEKSIEDSVEQCKESLEQTIEDSVERVIKEIRKRVPKRARADSSSNEQTPPQCMECPVLRQKIIDLEAANVQDGIKMVQDGIKIEQEQQRALAAQKQIDELVKERDYLKGELQYRDAEWERVQKNTIRLLEEAKGFARTILDYDTYADILASPRERTPQYDTDVNAEPEDERSDDELGRRTSTP